MGVEEKGETWWRGRMDLDLESCQLILLGIKLVSMVKQNPFEKWPETKNCTVSTLL
jgi:hypothetical protein